MTVGVVKWFNDKKGYGFIIDSEGMEHFCYYKNIVGEGFKTLKDGQKVDFNPVKGSKGMEAHDVRGQGNT